MLKLEWLLLRRYNMFYAIIKKTSFIGLGLFLALGLLGNSTAQADWKAEWEKTVEAAKKEGQLNIFIGQYWRVLSHSKRNILRSK